MVPCDYYILQILKVKHNSFALFSPSPYMCSLYCTNDK
uniref:Uncharacterized protein n=1 Tax=Arundo donax TaxID=35708 RepID=A0A0A8Y8X7_ARUDO